MPPNIKLLVCSSDAEFLASFAANGNAEKFSVISLPDATVLLSKVYDEMPHLIIMDIRSADVAAFDVCGQMKFDIILCHIPVIVLTDTGKGKNKIDCGADLYLQKPIAADELFYHIDRIVSQTIDELDINPLTNLPGNRSTFRKIESFLQEKKQFALCYIDLKNLGAYNEAHGIHRGDFLIRETATVIRQAAADFSQVETFVGHLGGDDFVLLADSRFSGPMAEKIIEFFDKSVPKFYEKEDQERGYLVMQSPDGQFIHHSFVCMSIAIITNDQIAYRQIADITKTAAQIQRYLKRFPASAYLKDRRSDIRDPVSAYDMSPALIAGWNDEPTIIQKKERRVSKDSEFLAAVLHFLKHEEQVDTFYQPIVHIPEGTIHGYEALSRFPKTGGGFMDPAMIFHAAREAELIKEFDVMCVRRTWANTQSLPLGQKLFINLNRETLIDPASLEEILGSSPVPLDQLVIELTEQSLVIETGQVMMALQRMRRSSIQFAIDDMGGGAVSLREVANIRPDYIKYDRSLIRDIETNVPKQKILNSLLVFAHSIGAKTTGEGIETLPEMQFLEKTGIDFGQGYLIGRPAKCNFNAVVVPAYKSPPPASSDPSRSS